MSKTEGSVRSRSTALVIAYWRSLRAGKHLDVLSQVEAMVERLNQRRMGKKPK